MSEIKATHWTTETVYGSELETMFAYDSDLTLEVSAEVPRDAAGERVPLRGNRYYPTLIRLTMGDDDVTLWPEQARQLASMLSAAAAACDAVDLPDVDPCGHWAPCSCPPSASPDAPERSQQRNEDEDHAR